MKTEHYKKEFFNQLISLNTLAEIIADQEQIDLKIIEKLKDKSLKVYHQLVVLEITVNKNIPDTENNIAEHNIVETKNNTNYSLGDIQSFNTEIEQLFSAEKIETNSFEKEDTINGNNENFKNVLEQSFVTNVITEPVKNIKTWPSLKQFLGFNDRLLIQNSLFTNNAELLNTFVTSIDNCYTSMQAINTINSYKQQYKWDNESDAFMNLISAIEQKFR